jgi:LAO/AO transport system kinase
MIDAERLAEDLMRGERAALARAVTLVESAAPRHRDVRQALLERVGGAVGGAHRIGVTGPPGAGKSTLIEALGQRLIAEGHRVAVLAIDPSSELTGGSVLGDKTRMDELSRSPAAFVRPSPSGGALGGVARKTRETMMLVEAAGFDVVLVETVGVGQSEVQVAEMVDTFLVLALPGAGDELQGIKRGILELADVIAVTKADGDHAVLARRTQQQLVATTGLLRPVLPQWPTVVLSCSSVERVGLDALMETLRAHRALLVTSGELAARRARQQVRWMRSLVQEGVWEAFLARPGVTDLVRRLEVDVQAGRLPASVAAERVLSCGAHGNDDGEGR